LKRHTDTGSSQARSRVYLGTCRARVGTKLKTKPCPNPVKYHGLWCQTHYFEYKAQVVAGEATWDDFERGRKRAKTLESSPTSKSRAVASEPLYSKDSEAGFEPSGSPETPAMPPLAHLLATATKERFFPKSVRDRVTRYPDDPGGGLLWCSCGNSTVAFEAWCMDGHLSRPMVAL
jgi:hypothetical protein